jgi:hypothetical protein
LFHVFFIPVVSFDNSSFLCGFNPISVSSLHLMTAWPNTFLPLVCPTIWTLDYSNLWVGSVDSIFCSGCVVLFRLVIGDRLHLFAELGSTLAVRFVVAFWGVPHTRIMPPVSGSFQTHPLLWARIIAIDIH